MFKILLKKQLAENFKIFFYDAKKGKMRNKWASIAIIAGYVLLFFGVIGGTFVKLSISLCEPLLSAGFGWLYFSIMSVLALCLGLFGSVFNTSAVLYQPKDNDLLLSMPIPVKYIVASRVASVCLLSLLFSGIVSLPAVVVYVVFAPSVAAVFGGLFLILSISLIVSFLSFLVGFLVAKITAKAKRKSLFAVLFALLFFAAYYAFIFYAQVFFEKIITDAGNVGATISKFYPLYALGLAGTGNVVAFLSVFAISAALFALSFWVLQRTFIKIATFKSGVAKTKYDDRKIKSQSVPCALLKKEFGRFFHSANYILNCSFGTIFLIIFAVYFAIFGSSLFDVFQNIFKGMSIDGFAFFLCGAVCALASMNDISAPSVSLEGKSIWILQSMPVSAWQIIKAKLNLHVIITAAPAFLANLIVLIVVKPNVWIWLLSLPFTFLSIALFALFGMFLGLLRPNLSWSNEVVVLKQSFSVFLCTIANMIFAALFVGLYFAVSSVASVELYLSMWLMLVVVLCFALYRWTKTKGCAIFENL